MGWQKRGSGWRRRSSARLISSLSLRPQLRCLVRQDTRLGGVFESFVQLDSESGDLVRSQQLLQALEKLAFLFADVGGELLRESRQAFRGHAMRFCLQGRLA